MRCPIWTGWVSDAVCGRCDVDRGAPGPASPVPAPNGARPPATLLPPLVHLNPGMPHGGVGFAGDHALEAPLGVGEHRRQMCSRVFLWLLRDSAMSGGVVQQPQGQPGPKATARGLRLAMPMTSSFAAHRRRRWKFSGRQDVLAYLRTKSSSPNVLALQAVVVAAKKRPLPRSCLRPAD
jgi:hypothetical protein